MSNQRERTYGFSRQDAVELLQTIGSGDSEFPEIRPRGGGSGFLRDIRIKPDGSALEKTYDGVTWIKVADIFTCE